LVVRAHALEAGSRRTAALANLGLAGFCIGLGVTEGADIGALFALLFAAWFVVDSVIRSGRSGTGIRWSVPRLAAIALLAGWFATHSLVALVGANVSGIKGTSQDAATRQQRWDWATQWSLPKREALGIAIPGLFGYRMDTEQGGNYWGASGRDAAWDRYFASGAKGPPPPGMIRYSGGGSYAGILVLLVAGWAVWQSLRRSAGIFDALERRQIWFWGGAGLICLLLAFGRHAPFYQAFYALPFVSTIRNPVKFLHLLQFTLIMIFAMGVHRLPWEPSSVAGGWRAILRDWVNRCSWARGWLMASGGLLLLALAGFLAYRGSLATVAEYLTRVDFTATEAGTITAFSLGQLGWFVLTLAIGLVVLLLVFCGWAARIKTWLPAVLLSVVLIADFSRANAPWIVYFNARERYAPDAITGFLAPRIREARTTVWPFPLPSAFLALDQMYRLEWLQHQFPYHNVRALELVQLRSSPEDLAELSKALSCDGTVETLPRVTRSWELANTRYVLAPTNCLKAMQTELDPVRQRFRIVDRFNIVPRPGIERPLRSKDFTTVLSTNGLFAIFEFTGALPRAGFYARWESVTNRWEAIERLRHPAFDPSTMVLVEGEAAGTNAAVATTVQAVPLAAYDPRRLVFNLTNSVPGVLLLSEHFDPRWRVSVNGHPSEVLVCNAVFRGVKLPPGSHHVEFLFVPPASGLWASVAAAVAFLLLLGAVVWLGAPAFVPAALPQREPSAQPAIRA
jgi:hypothetical protein